MQRIMVIDEDGIKREIANALFRDWNNRTAPDDRNPTRDKVIGNVIHSGSWHTAIRNLLCIRCGRCTP
ncbi:hypothetical protein D3C81_935720 [compost metagenome]